MDAQRARRVRDHARKSWYAHYRQFRFARWLGFVDADADLRMLFQKIVAEETLNQCRQAVKVGDETVDTRLFDEGPTSIVGLHDHSRSQVALDLISVE